MIQTVQGTCIAMLWNNANRVGPIQCPVDRTRVTAILPSFAMRAAISRIQKQQGDEPQPNTAEAHLFTCNYTNSSFRKKEL